MSKDRSEIKLETLTQTPYVYDVIIDALQEFDKEHTGASANRAYYMLFIDKLKYKYLNSITPKVNIFQKDLEDEINEVKNK